MMNRINFKLAVYSLLLGVLLFGCQDQRVSVVDEEIQDEELTFAKIPLLSDEDAAKQISDNQSDYYCLVSTLHDNEKINPYRYSAVWLHFPKGILDKVEKKSTEDMWLSVVLGDSKASEKKGVSKFSEDGVVRMARCFLPDLPEAREMIQDKIIEFSPDSWVGSSQKTTGKQPTQSNSSFCEERFVTEVCRSTAGIVYDCQITEDRCVEYDFGGSGTWPEFDGDEEEGNSGGGGSTIPEDPEEGCQDYGDPCYTEDGLPVSCPGEDEDEDHGQDDMFQTLSKDLAIYNSSGNMTLDSTCSDEEEEEDEFFGDITIDESVRENSKANCVLDRLLNEGNTLSNTIVKFAEDTVSLNLHIELADLGPADGDQYGNIINGNLLSSNLSNTFYLQLNENRIENRTPIEIAATYLHEAIHAEMRRYIYGEIGTSTLQGFPGDFTDDWALFIDMFFGGNVEDGEHETMSSKYRSIIVDGLKEFGDLNFSQSDYDAIAWIGLQGTNAYELESESVNIDEKISNAKDKATLSCEL